MALTTSDTGITLIKKFEGCKLTSYQDSAGVWTIGYGHTSGVKSGQTITQAQADAYLKADLASAEKNVNSFNSTYGWNQNQFDALVSFAFNIGSINQLTANGTRTIAQISSKITAYNKAGGKVLQGLVNRRAAEKELFDTAVKSTTTANSVPSYTAGKTYTIQVDHLTVRKGAGKSYAAVSYANLTANAKQNAYSNGTLKKGTKITCKATQTVGSDIWMQIPSGWIAAYYSSNTYVK